MADVKKVRYGIVGIGKQGTWYAKFIFKGLDKNAELAAICDISKERREWAEKNLQGVKIFEDYNEMFKSGLVDAVMVETPHYFHPVIVKAALEANLNVMSDKPAGVYTKAVRETVEFAKTKPELKCALLLNQRTNKVYREAKKIIDSGALGKLKRIAWIITNWYRPQAYYDQGGWRGTWAGEGGGVLLNQDPHQLDLFTWLAGEKITKVWAKAKTVGRKINVENDVTAWCEFESGATGVFITSTHEAPGTNRLEISGDGGKIVISGKNDLSMKLEFTKNDVPEPEFSATNTVFMGKPKTKTTVVKYSPFEVIKILIKNWGFQHPDVIRNFSNVILGNEDKLIGRYEEGLNGLTFSNAIHLSSWTGKEIQLPIDEELFISELEKRKAEEAKSSKK